MYAQTVKTYKKQINSLQRELNEERLNCSALAKELDEKKKQIGKIEKTNEQLTQSIKQLTNTKKI